MSLQPNELCLFDIPYDHLDFVPIILLASGTWPLKLDRKSSWFRMGYALLAAILLSACGQFLLVGTSTLAWCVLRELRPESPTPAVVAASIFVATMVLSLFAFAAGGRSVPTVVGGLLAESVALLLVFHGATLWAYLLIALCLFNIIASFLTLRRGGLIGVPTRETYGAFVLNVFIISLLVAQLRAGNSGISRAQPSPRENG